MGLIVVPFGRDENEQDMTHEQLRFGLVKDRMMRRNTSGKDFSLCMYSVLWRHTESQIHTGYVRHSRMLILIRRKVQQACCSHRSSRVIPGQGRCTSESFTLPLMSEDTNFQ
jgi:hypothetical protein